MLFQYDSSAQFTVNLVFDNRQATTLEARDMKSAIDDRGRSYASLTADYESLLAANRLHAMAYESAVSEYNADMNDYNATVTRWNAAGGAPADEIGRLERRKTGLDARKSTLDADRDRLNGESDAINDLVRRINALAERNNLDVSLFNGKFVHVREFDKGVFDGTSINIYQYTDRADLIVALTHEFGHALGFPHTQSPESIMYYKLEKQDLDRIHLSGDDLALLKAKIADIDAE